jgi:hypothetical protein
VKANIRVKGKQEKSDWSRIAKMLRQAGYKGYLALEYEEKEPAATAVPPLLEKLRQVIAEA